MAVIDAFKRAVFGALGLNPDDEPPRIDRLAFYRAEVKAASSDGATVDVTPEDTRIEPHQKVPLRVGIPGATAVVQPGAIVHIGWEAGRPDRIFAVPLWEAGANVTKLILKASTVHVGDESGSEFVALSNKVLTELQAIVTAFNAHTHPYVNVAAPATTSAPTAPASNPSSVAATKAKAV